VEYCDFDLDGSRLVVQGFGSVGKHAARFLALKGVVLVGAADSQGTLYDPDGIDIDTLIKIKNEGGSVLDYPQGKKGDIDTVIDLDCEIWIPAARPDVLNADNVSRLSASLVAQGANIPCTEEAEVYLYSKGVLCLPDFIANAGGVICAAMEYHGASQYAAMQAIGAKVAENMRQVLEEAETKNILPRQAAIEMAIKRVKKGMELKRWSIF
jgi:glutamate dehydrogenase (NAD(P)+)